MTGRHTSPVGVAEAAARQWQRGPGPLPEPATTELPSSDGLMLERWPSDDSWSALFDLSLAVTPGEERRSELRRVPSAGGRHPVIAFLQLAGQEQLLRYDPIAHSLRTTVATNRPGPVDRVTLAVDCRPSVGKYGRRSLPSVLLDTGHAIGALALAARALGLTDVVCAHFGTVPSGAVHFGAVHSGSRLEIEGPIVLATITLGPESASADIPSAAPSRQAAIASAANRSAPDAVELITQALAVIATETERSCHALLVPRVDPTVLTQRRSAPVPMDGPAESPVEDTAARSAAVALESLANTSTPMWVAVADADGIHQVTSDQRIPIARGDARAVLAGWACGQNWLSAASIMLIVTGDPGAAVTERRPAWPWDPAAYGRAHLAAGAAVQSALATASAAATRPVGCWGDADLGSAIGWAAGAGVVIHGLALGNRKDLQPTPHQAVVT